MKFKKEQKTNEISIKLMTDRKKSGDYDNKNHLNSWNSINTIVNKLNCLVIAIYRMFGVVLYCGKGHKINCKQRKILLKFPIHSMKLSKIKSF